MSAIISACGKYRYRLERDCGMPFDGSKTFAYFGINPSTADATLDDATVRKWRGFTVRNGGHRFIVGNVFSYRATDVRELARQPFPQGPEHYRHLQQIIAAADLLVPCWGASAKLPVELRHHLSTLLAWLQRTGKPMATFGMTSCGQPKHPLMLGYDTPLDWMQP
ncbi:hypothetical protein K32_49270 [Kaistia sp. 32K]|uniref:DUF1643 domain-containing protein n=1 Tax=Kaistia sp. 32K TaxID=2795690 RepID=UPI0019169BFF|nr:DUF1643 domain-containing protein [Kaistia sp. 32K]BCP56310.1 hypothetical protein K32_49270 [Kaistia sp. 32K]